MRTILIVEDDSNLRELYTNALSASGYQVEQVSDTNKALMLLSQKQFSLILLDLLFPGMDGVQVIKTLRTSNALNSDTPIIVLTNVSGDKKITEALEAGANKYLFKAQHTPKSITKEVGNLLNQNQQT